MRMRRTCTVREKHFVCLVRAIISIATASLLSPWMGNGAYRVFLRLALGTPRLSIVTGTFSCGRERLGTLADPRPWCLLSLLTPGGLTRLAA